MFIISVACMPLIKITLSFTHDNVIYVDLKGLAPSGF